MTTFLHLPGWLFLAAALLIALLLAGLLSTRVAAFVALAFALVFGVYQWGASDANAKWQAKEAKRLHDEAIAAESERRRGEKASGALQADLLQRSIERDNLEAAFNEYKRQHPIIVRRRIAPPSAAAVGPAPALAGGDEQPAQDERAAVGDDVSLSLGAVWMWNSALLGRDAPAGACGLADTSEAACAPEAGISLQQAWDNQAINAAICSETATRYQRLIDFLKGKQQ